ncbi:hypothetical protein Y032_0020g198 [Ancylostoma ceylanicum]|uniref:aECM cysteine-cradle domain-containing protein n=1 Tax=Ancylostoma ceylanicum TaxID=53326 RepID=A0A016V244_9BILA|nr:hypothetical protein Y032_0020g198 [Ancylostoma ceylanicum]
MGWRALLLLAVACRAVEEEHFIDVKQIVKGRPDLPVMFSPEADVSVLYQALKAGTIEAVAKLPPITPNETELDSEKKPEEFYKLFQLPADIMTKLAADAGYIDHPHTTTSAPWIVRRKVHTSSEDGESFTQYESEEQEEKPKKKKKYYKKDPTLIAISDLLPKMEKTSQVPIVPLQPAPGTTSLTNLRTLPVVQSATDLGHSNVQPQYAYQPIVQPDGKTYYQQVLILPGQIVASKDALPRMDSNPFVQEKPRTVLQADYTVAAPTFPPPVDVFRREPMVEPTTPAMRTEIATRQSAYPSRYIRPSGNVVYAQPREAVSRVQVPQNDPIAIPSSHRPVPQTFRAERQYVPPPPPKESLFSTKLPSGEEQRINARVFHEEAAVPPRSAMKVTQASPLRIRTIDSHIESATTAETEKMSTLKRGEELKKVMEQHRREVEPGSRKRKLRKTKKSGKLSKKNKSLDVDSTEMASSEKGAEEYRKTVRRMPQTQFLERVPILTPPAMRKRERVYASKTWKKRRYEPVDMVIPNDLESFEEKTGVEDVTEPPRKRRKLRKSHKSKKAIVYIQNDATGIKEERQGSGMHVTEPEQDPVTSAPLKRKVLRLNRLRENPETSKMGSEERSVDSRSDRPKKLKRTKRVKKMKSSTSHSHSHMSTGISPLRQHCLNIRTFARQFGISDVEEFSRVLVKKLDGLRVRFHSVAAAQSQRDLFDPLTWSTLSPQPSSRYCRDSAGTKSVYLFEKDCM